jgi:hypothetical protein
MRCASWRTISACARLTTRCGRSFGSARLSALAESSRHMKKMRPAEVLRVARTTYPENNRCRRFRHSGSPVCAAEMKGRCSTLAAGDLLFTRPIRNEPSPSRKPAAHAISSSSAVRAAARMASVGGAGEVPADIPIESRHGFGATSAKTPRSAPICCREAAVAARTARAKPRKAPRPAAPRGARREAGPARRACRARA